MSFGGKKPKAAVSTTTTGIGKDPLSRRLAAVLNNESRKSNVTNALAKEGVEGIRSADNASGLKDPSVDLLRRTISGEFTDPAAISGQIEAAAAPTLREFRRSVAPSIAGRFAASGRTGSGAERGAFQDAEDRLSRSIAETASGVIQTERGRQQAASGIFPQLQAGEAQRASALLAQGNTDENEDLQRILQIASTVPSLRTSTSTSRGATQGQAGKGGALGSLAGAGVGAFFGGPGGAQLGSQLGGTAGSLF